MWLNNECDGVWTCVGVGHYDCVSQLTVVDGDIKNENILAISSKADTVLAVSGQFYDARKSYSEFPKFVLVKEVNLLTRLETQQVLSQR